MKYLSLAALAAVLISSASAATVTLTGGLNGLQFGYTTTLQNPTFVAFANSGQSLATISVGSFQGTVFSAFASADSTSPAFGSGVMAGRWLGDASDNGPTADVFAGRQVWFQISTTFNGQTYTGYFADTGTLFPVNDGGVNDDITVDSRNLDTVSPNSTGTWIIDGSRVTLAIPEPSIALLGSIGVLALLRRRR